MLIVCKRRHVPPLELGLPESQHRVTSETFLHGEMCFLLCFYFGLPQPLNLETTGGRTGVTGAAWGGLDAAWVGLDAAEP